MKIYAVPTALVPELWDAAKPFLALALEYHPFLTAQGLLQRILAGEAQLIVAVEKSMLGAAAMEIVAYPHETVGNIIAMGGVPGFYQKYLTPFTDHLEQWCKQRQCQKIGMLGRRGWVKFVTKRGWKTQEAIAAWKELPSHELRFLEPAAFHATRSRDESRH